MPAKAGIDGVRRCYEQGCGLTLAGTTTDAGMTTNLSDNCYQPKETNMGRGILLWLLGVPIPIIILLALLWH